MISNILNDLGWQTVSTKNNCFSYIINHLIKSEYIHYSDQLNDEVNSNLLNSKQAYNSRATSTVVVFVLVF